MCDYSMHAVKTKDAATGDKLITRAFTHSTKGFGLVSEREIDKPATTWSNGEGGVCESEGACAVCLKPGTEVGFDKPVRYFARVLGIAIKKTSEAGVVAIFRKVDPDVVCRHHDALEFPDGTVVFLNDICEGQCATVIQLPAPPVVDRAREEGLKAIAQDLRRMQESLDELEGSLA